MMACLLAMTFYLGSSPGMSQKPVYMVDNANDRPTLCLKYAVQEIFTSVLFNIEIILLLIRALSEIYKSYLKNVVILCFNNHWTATSRLTA